MYTHIHKYVFMCSGTYTCMNMYTYIYIYMYAYTCIHIYTNLIGEYNFENEIFGN